MIRTRRDRDSDSPHNKREALSSPRVGSIDNVSTEVGFTQAHQSRFDAGVTLDRSSLLNNHSPVGWTSAVAPKPHKRDGRHRLRPSTIVWRLSVWSLCAPLCFHCLDTSAPGFGREQFTLSLRRCKRIGTGYLWHCIPALVRNNFVLPTGKGRRATANRFVALNAAAAVNATCCKSLKAADDIAHSEDQPGNRINGLPLKNMNCVTTWPTSSES